VADSSQTERPTRVLHPGDYAIAPAPTVLSTLLGSCVAVCLYDPLRRVIGMNHFLLANRRYSRDTPVLASEAGRYGIHAMELLINGMLAHGCHRDRLRAKAFGGGNVLGHACGAQDNFQCVGAVNVRFVRAFLEQDRIPLVAADLGGNFGRQIHCDGQDFSVYVRKIPSSQSAHLVEEERHYWHHEVAEHESTTGNNIQFW
jgi:chemotaxis protein CheD